MRIFQLYKNILVFLPLIFVGEVFNQNAFIRVFLAFIALCLVSFSSYIINDVIDKEKDKHHPEKKKRLIASGKLNSNLALLISLKLTLISFSISYHLNYYFFLSVLALFVSSSYYTFILKKKVFLDILSISLNFVIRAVAGVFVIFPNQIVRISPWLILVPFFLAMFLATAKRRSNILLLGENKYNEIQYDEKTTSFLFSVSTTLLILNYSLFTFYSDFPFLFLTIPVVLYSIFYFHKKVEEGSRIGRDLSYAFLNGNLIISLIIWSSLVYFIIYF